ncbi:DUF2357 domain-containing protein [Corallococcus coralloides]|uniref:DUF2357 domain-containing protein n=1 Tax=Corallococcus coralloides TaxID=184914 RepID=UPI0002D79000|nr:DUF2357 domain-containing protein [Corallococcus coralloides]
MGGFYKATGSDSAILAFGNAVGRFEAPGLGPLSVVSGKWGEEHFDRMLADLMRVAASLPFSIGDRALMPFDHSVVQQGEVLYHAFVYLRHVLSDSAPRDAQLLPALRLVLAEPHRILESEHRSIPSEQARGLDARGLVRIMEQPHHWSAVPWALAERSALASALKQHLPRQIEERATLATHDTAENRFVKAFLDLAASVIQGIRKAVAGLPSRTFVPRILKDCDWMEQALQPIRTHTLWKQVGRLHQLPVLSTVLPKRLGYKAIFGHFSKLRMASTCLPLSAAEITQLLEVKDITLMYELWTYFTLVEQIRRRLGPPIEARSVQSEPLESNARRGLLVRWPNGVEASFNTTYSRSSKNGRRSYSLMLRPDISLWLPDDTEPRLHLFDAKFRLKWKAPKKDDDIERASSFQNEDLHKMHTYRDAIAQVRTAWSLYPGDEFICYRADGVLIELPHELGPDAEGIGAIPMRPGDTEELLSMVLGRLMGTPGL